MPASLPKQIMIGPPGVKRRHILGEMDCHPDGRLSSMIRSYKGRVSADLMVTLSERRPLVTGKILANVVMDCQRCLGPVEVELQCEVDLVLVGTESEYMQLPDNIEAAVCEEDMLDIHQLVEDELILALPIVPMHEHCNLPAQMQDRDENGAGDTSSPFSVLKDFRRT